MGVPQSEQVLILGGVSSQTGTSVQNLAQSIGTDHQPLTQWPLDTEVKPSLLVGLFNSPTNPYTVNNLYAISAYQSPDGAIKILANLQGTPLTFAAGANHTATGASGTLIAANAARRYLCIINTDSAAHVSIDLSGGAAVDLKGIVIGPLGSYELSEANGNLMTGIIKCITAGGSVVVSLQEAT
jgi:hypothetical protein